MTVMTRKTATMVPALATGPSLHQRYRALLDGPDAASAEWLQAQLARVQHVSDDLPSDPAQLQAWSAQHAAQVAATYADYLEQRRQGAPRRFFSSRAQALWFLQQVAPTKAVDGAWLHSTLRHWADPATTA